jgi:hypothetical protein
MNSLNSPLVCLFLGTLASNSMANGQSTFGEFRGLVTDPA